MMNPSTGASVDLHDATLINLKFNWKFGTVEIEFRSSRGPQVLIAKGLTSLKCERSFPWGPSCSVNSVEAMEQDSCVFVSLEMQSGDVIALSCESFTVADKAPITD